MRREIGETSASAAMRRRKVINDVNKSDRRNITLPARFRVAALAVMTSRPLRRHHA